MSINKTTILAAVNQRLTLNETNIATKIVTILQEISSRIPGILQKSSTVTIAANAYSGVWPTDYVEVRSLVGETHKPLEFVGGLDNLNAKFEADITQGEPEFFHMHNDGNVYVWPRPTTSTALTLHYCYQDTSASSITMPDVVQEAIIEGVCHLLELGRGTLGDMTEQAWTHKTLYEDQIKMLTNRYGKY